MVSTMTGPIPPHPYYDKSDTNMKLDLSKPRVKPEAQTYYKQGQGSVGMVLQIEGQRVPSAYRRTVVQPKNHVAENVRRMRKIQRETKKKDEGSVQPVKALWKSSKYENVNSRVRENLQNDPDAPRPSSATYLRAHSRTGFLPQSARPSSTEPPEEKLTVPKAQSAREVSSHMMAQIEDTSHTRAFKQITQVKLIRRDVDFVKHNGKGVRATPMRRSPSLTQLEEYKAKRDEEERTYRKGQVPGYLQKRQKDWDRQEQERIANMPDPDMPPGHKLLPDNERQQTLNKLKLTQDELTRQMASLPIRTDTLRLRTQKEALENKLVEVEEAIKIFSRPKVFVKQDT